MHSGVHPSLHPKCHHHPKCYPKCSGVQQANTNLIKRVIELFGLEKSLRNLGENKQISVFNETVMNIFENIIRHKSNTL